MKNALLHDGLRYWAQCEPDRLALAFGEDETLSYGSLARWSDAIAARLQDHGVKAGDTVCICAANSIAWVACAFGILKAGAIIVPLNERFVAGELAYLIEQTEPAALIADEPRAMILRDLSDVPIMAMEDTQALRGGAPAGWREVRVASDALAQIIFTSGTTGKPKGVMIAHGQLLDKQFEVRLVDEHFGSPGFRMLMPVSLQSGVGTTWGYLTATTNGGMLCFMPRFDPALALRMIVKWRVTNLPSFPLLLEQIAAQPEFDEADLSSIRTAITGGTRVPPEIVTRWRQKGVMLRPMYGLTEAGNYVTLSSDREVAEDRSSCGVPLIFTEVRIVQEDGTEAPVGEPGEIRVRGPGMMVGYWRNPEATGQTLVDGWVHTGDLGRFDEDGFLHFVDRQKDMIITGGFNVSPSEVEEVIGQFPGIVESAVVPVPDARFGETPAAIIVGDAEPEALFAFCKERLAGFKLPRYIVQSPKPLPRNTNNKLQKQVLRSLYADVPETHVRLG